MAHMDPFSGNLIIVGVFMAMAFLCFVIIQGNLCGINIVKRLLWVYDMGWCWGWARTYSHLTILYRMVYRAAKTWDGFRGFWEICRSNKGLLANRSVLSFQSSSIEQTNPCQTSLKGMSKYHQKILYIYILFMSLQLRVYVSYCKAETRTTDLHDLHQYHQSNRFGIVSLTRCTSFGETCWCPRKAMCHDSAGQNRITRPVPKAVAICPTWCLHFSMLFLCEVWSGKIWCWIWTLADRCGSLLRIPANSLMWCASIRGTCWIAGTS